MDSVYKKLALHLDAIPNGFPETRSGVELKILAKLFDPDEAKLACLLTTTPQPAASIAALAGRNERDTFIQLKGMVKKGLIEAERGTGSLHFKLIPFIVGFYENQNARIDAEFAKLFETYYHEALHKMMTVPPSVHRVIPVEESIPVGIEVMPYEKASTYLENAKAWGVLPCICRVQKRLIGDPCGHTEENCLVLSQRPGAFDRTDAIRAITKQEAHAILTAAGKEGLVHSTSNVRQNISYICNCCTCSCGVLRGIAEYGSLNAVGRSDFFASIDTERCTGCGACTRRCQFKALQIENNLCSVNLTLCYGCGVCISACPENALRLEPKAKDETSPPLATEEEWGEQRIQARKKLNEIT